MRYRLALLLLLTGCSGNLSTLQEMKPAGTDFNSALASEYQAYSESEYEQGRYLSSNHYAGKGVRVLKGETVEPEVPDSSLPEKTKQDAISGRASLMTLLTDRVKKTSPQELARAQLLFDCWQHELARDINQAKAPCADGFKSTLSELQDENDSLFYDHSTDYTIDFAPGSSTVSKKASALLTKIVKQARRHGRYAIEVDSHSNGGDSVKLGEARIAAVKKVIIQAGVPATHVLGLNEDDSKKVYIGSDEAPKERDQVVVTVKTHKS